MLPDKMFVEGVEYGQCELSKGGWVSFRDCWPLVGWRVLVQFSEDEYAVGRANLHEVDWLSLEGGSLAYEYLEGAGYSWVYLFV